MQPEEPAQESPRNLKPLIIVLVVLVLLAGTGYSVYAWQQNQIAKLDKQIKELKAEAKDTSSAEPTPAVATDTYKTPTGYLEYTVTKPDFSFAYPKSIGSLKLTTMNLNDAKYKDQDVKGTSVIIGPTTNTANNDIAFRVLSASTDYVPFGTDDPLEVFTAKGYTKSGSTYTIPLSGSSGNNTTVISSKKDFAVVQTRSGEAVVFSVENAEGGGSTAIGIVNLPSSTGYKAIGITANSISELKSILATLKLGQ